MAAQIHGSIDRTKQEIESAETARMRGWVQSYIQMLRESLERLEADCEESGSAWELYENAISRFANITNAIGYFHINGTTELHKSLKDARKV